ncbi:MAG: cytochrome c, partial [Planctomycetales bacterium]
RFKSSGYKTARVEFATLAVLFGVVAQYDGDVRWKDQAAGIRDAMASAGFACSEGSDDSHRLAKQQTESLTEMVRGIKVSFPEASPTVAWGDVAELLPLMKRMAQANKGLKGMLASGAEFESDKDKVLKEAQILAALAKVIQDPEEEAEYVGFAKQLQHHAMQLAKSAEQDQFNQAAQSLDFVMKTCTACHDEYQ